MRTTASARLAGVIFHAAKSLLITVVRLQAVVGLVLLYVGAASMWRPAVGMLIVGALLVLDDVCDTIRNAGKVK